MAWQRRHRGLDAIVTVACFLATISLCSGGIPYNVTLASVTLFHKYSWFTAPAVYLSCGDGSGGNRTELPGVNATMRWFNFTGNESWQPVAKLHREECTTCRLKAGDGALVVVKLLTLLHHTVVTESNCMMVDATIQHSQHSSLSTELPKPSPNSSLPLSLPSLPHLKLFLLTFRLLLSPPHPFLSSTSTTSSHSPHPSILPSTQDALQAEQLALPSCCQRYRPVTPVPSTASPRSPHTSILPPGQDTLQTKQLALPPCCLPPSSPVNGTD
ncbi:unnamed protein product [Closterium sp. NIES-54]